MSDFNELVGRYIALWNEKDPARRRAAISEIWVEDGSYVDPIAVAEGQDGINSTISTVQAQFPGHTFRLAGPVDSHHNLARFTWELAQGEDEAVVVGFDVAVVADDGRLRNVHGFLDKIPVA